MGLRASLSLLVLVTSCLMINAVDLGHLTWTQAPHHAPTYPPTQAPAPHKGGHHKGGGHHHKAPTVAPVHPPVKAPVHPPVKAPVKAPVHPPVKAPVKAPVHPPVKAPVHPPVKAPVKAPVHPPVKAPVKAPVYPPTKAPVHPPIKAPVQPPVKAPAPHAPVLRKMVAVRGMVYCKACKYRGIDTLTSAIPLQGAVVLLTCNNTKYPLRVKSTTDKHGFFFIMAPKTLTTYGVHKCRVTLLASKSPKCNHPTNLHYGVKGATLVPTPKAPIGSKVPTLPYDVYTVGPFAYEPSKKTPCPKA